MHPRVKKLQYSGLEMYDITEADISISEEHTRECTMSTGDEIKIFT